MSGKAYTMREMKGIVDYLTEHNAYGETKARKMWMDFASSKLTNRTWQSLKETFLKRILPDIHNPYYKLSMDQIRSFRQGCDVVAKEQNRLIIRTESDDTNSNAESDKEEPTNGISGKEAVETPGETIKSSQITTRTRSSVETVVLDKCYATADEIRKDLESPRIDDREETRDANNQVSKSEENLLNKTESLPISTLMTNLLDDFTSDPETEIENKTKDKSSEAPNEDTEAETIKDTEIIVLSSEATGANEDKSTSGNDEPDEPEEDKDGQSSPIVLEETETNTVDSDVVVIEDSCIQIDSNSVGDNTENQNENCTTTCKTISQTEKHDVVGQNSSNTTDASLPNNPEGLNKINALDKHEKCETNPDDSKKRSNSNDMMEVDEHKQNNVSDRVENLQTNTTQDNNAIQKTFNDIGSSEDKLIIAEEHEKHEELPKSIVNSEVVQNVSTDSSAVVEQNGKEDVNPCLKSVSLYEEQFKKIKYSDSESSAHEDTTPSNPNQDISNNNNKETSNFPKDVVILRSHSESDPEPKLKKTMVPTRVNKDKALANVFGISYGVSSSRKRRCSYNRKPNRHHYKYKKRRSENRSSPPSEWTSQSDSDAYVSPPRGRKRKYGRKYLKPQSARVYALEEEGGLFVMHGKKIYPLVKDGKTVKNYLSYLPDSDSEENESYWKQKYFEEKNKAEELKKLLVQQSKEAINRDASPILHPSLPRKPTHRSKTRQSVQSVNNDQDKPIMVDTDEQKADDKKRDKQEKVKIKFTRNNEEVHLEGHWQQLHPVLEQVVHIFNKDSDHTDKPKPVLIQPEQTKSLSGMSTPVIIHQSDSDVKEKIDKLEKEIFQKIEALDKEEQNIQQSQPEQTITKKKPGRPRKSPITSTTLLAVPAKKRRVSKSPEERTTRRTKSALEPKPAESAEVFTNPDKSPDKSTKESNITNTQVNETEDKDISITSTGTRDTKSRDTSNELNTSNGKLELEDKNLPTSTSNNQKRPRKTLKNADDAKGSPKTSPPTVMSLRRSTPRKLEPKTTSELPKKVTRSSIKSDDAVKQPIGKRTRKIQTRR